MTQFLGIQELAETLGVSRQRAHDLSRRAGFPKPDHVTGGQRPHRCWKASAVARWMKANGR